MIVIKLGGSLMTDKASLIHCLDTIDRKYSENVVIVPGGGQFADQVRALQKQWGFNEQVAHQMALLAMQQMALLISSFKQNFVLAGNVAMINQALKNHPVIIWQPQVDELDSSNVQASWDITSDSLAAWVADQLQATELILVKSANIPEFITIEQMSKLKLVDNAFFEFVQNASYKITLINKHNFNE